MTGLDRQERWTVTIPGHTLEQLRRAIVKAATGTEPAPHPWPLPLELELTTCAQRLDEEPERQNVHSTAYENVHAVKFGSGKLYGFTVYNSKASAQFIQVFDNSRAPASGDVPDVVFTAAASSNLGVDWIPGRPFRTGCFIANSSTGPTYTAGSADCFFDVQFI